MSDVTYSIMKKQNKRMMTSLSFLPSIGLTLGLTIVPSYQFYLKQLSLKALALSMNLNISRHEPST
jgi:hypothetical protein